MEEAKKNMYAFSTTTYTGFQCTVSEETSEKFKGMCYFFFWFMFVSFRIWTHLFNVELRNFIIWAQMSVYWYNNLVQWYLTESRILGEIEPWNDPCMTKQQQFWNENYLFQKILAWN